MKVNRVPPILIKGNVVTGLDVDSYFDQTFKSRSGIIMGGVWSAGLWNERLEPQEFLAMHAVVVASRLLPCALGIRVHSGWGAAVVVSGGNGSEQILDRRRIQIVEPNERGAAQPFHLAQKLSIEAAEKHILACASKSTRLAFGSVQAIAEAMAERGHQLVRAAILLSSGRTLPELSKILASHALIHAAEGEFFRDAFRNACARLKIPVTGIRERELEQQAAAAFGGDHGRVKKKIVEMGRVLGPPWTTDQKSAAVAAAIALVASPRGANPRNFL